MKPLLKQIRLVCILLLAGCVTSSSNSRVWISGNLKATGAIDSNGKAVYHHIRIGNDRFPYDGGQAFVIRLSNGVLLSSTDFSEPTIRRAAATVKPSDRRIENDFMTGKRSYSFCGVMFEYNEDRSVVIDIAWVRLPQKTYVPEIAQTEADTFCPFPVPEEQLKRIFGPPDEIRNAFVW